MVEVKSRGLRNIQGGQGQEVHVRRCGEEEVLFLALNLGIILIQFHEKQKKSPCILQYWPNCKIMKWF